MQPLKTLILEDNPDDLELLQDLISTKDYANDIHVSAVATNFLDAARLLTNDRFDLSILDFELDKNKNLDDVVDLVGTDNMGIIALHTKTTTGNHASAEKLHMDIYMGKPFSEIGMLEFITKLRKIRLLKTSSDEKIQIKVNGEMIFLNPDDICYIQGAKNHSDFYCKTGNDNFIHFKAQGGIGETEQLLRSNKFIRCHASYIINVKRIAKIGVDEDIFFDLNDKEHIAYYSGSYKNELIKLGLLQK